MSPTGHRDGTRRIGCLGLMGVAVLVALVISGLQRIGLVEDKPRRTDPTVTQSNDAALQSARQARADAAAEYVGGFEGATWHDVMTDAALVGEVMTVTTSVFPDDEGKAAVRQLCAAWNVGLNRKVGGWDDDIILIEIYGQDESRVAHLSPFSMTCK